MNKGFITIYERDNGALLTSFPGDASLNKEYRIIHYEENGRDIFKEWLKSLRDPQGEAAIYRVLDRVARGNFGKHHFCRDGVWELTIDMGPGYRIYYSMMGNTLVLLLCAGSKRTQDRDIDCAVTYLRKFKEAYQK